MTVAKMADLYRLFIHVTGSDAPKDNVSIFLENPKQYIVKNKLAPMELSTRQARHLTIGAPIANRLNTVMKVGDTQRKWLPGAVAATAACRPAYNGNLYLSATSGVDGDVIPDDPIARVLWGWYPNPGSDLQRGENKEIKKMVDAIAAHVPGDWQGVFDELKLILG